VRNLSLKWRLVLAAAAIIGPVLLLLGLFIHLNSRSHMLDVATDNLRGQAQLAAREISGLLARPPHRINSDALADSISAAIGRRVTIIDGSGRVLGDSDEDEAGLAAMDNHLGRPEIRGAGLNGWGYSIRYSHTLKKDMIYLAVPVVVGGRNWGYCRVAWPMSSFRAHQRSLAGILLLGLAASGTLMLLLMGSLWRRAVKAIGQMERTAGAIIGGDLESRAPTNLGIPELDRISRTMNGLAESWSRTAAELRDRSLKLSAILEGMSEGVVVLGHDQRVALINRFAAGLLDAGGDAVGRSILEIIRHPGVKDLLEGQIEELDFEYRGRHLLAHASPLASGAGTVVVLADVTRLTSLERVRRDFVANVSHELKTPLAAVVGFTEALRDGAKDKAGTRDDFIERIGKQSARMTRLLDDLLELSSLESEGVRMDAAPVEARALADKAVENLSQAAQARGQKVSVSDSPGGSALVMADEQRIAQALGNMLDNAVKYSPEGSRIEMDFRRQGGMLEISVSDPGPGIASEHLPRLFERFYRVDKSRSRELGGTGLGLAIAKHIAELHGGKAGVESELGRGSRFWLALPLAGKTGGEASENS